MSGRKCGNCRHYEPSPIWRSGWCRNPRLYGPQESHLVRHDELACAHRLGNYWEPVEDDEPDGSKKHHGLVGSIVRPFRLFGPGPRLVAAASGPPGGRRFGPSGGSGGGSGGSGSLSSSGTGRDAFGGSGAGGARPPQGSYGESSRPDRTGRLPGQERIVSYQPEERYWTDYLRIALPVVGLLLMLGLFWFWAANLIGDDDDDGPPATVLATNTTPTVTETVVAADGAETPAAAPTDTPPPAGETATTAAGGETPPAAPTATQPPADEGPDQAPTDGFAAGSLVEVNTNDLNFRPEPSTQSTPIRTLDNGEELTVVTGPEEAEGLTWYQVEDASGTVGWVAADFIQAIE